MAIELHKNAGFGVFVHPGAKRCWCPAGKGEMGRCMYGKEILTICGCSGLKINSREMDI